MADTAAPTTTDNNVAATQAANASYAASHPNIFGSGGSSTPPTQATGPNSNPIPNGPNFGIVNSTNTAPTSQVSLPTVPPSTAPAVASASAAATTPSVDDYMAKLTPATTPLDQQVQDILNQGVTLANQDTGKTQYELQQEAVNGVPQMQTDLSNLQGQQTVGQASLDQLNVEKANALAAPAVNNGVAGPGIEAAQNTAVGRQYDAKIAAQAAQNTMVAAQIQAKQGNIANALTLSTNAVNAKYAPVEDAIKVQTAQLAAIQPLLTQEQKTQALAQQQVLKDQADAVQAQKDTETQINNVALQAASAGASPDVIAGIQNSPDVISAIAAATPALGAAATQKLQQDAFDNNIKLQQLMISKAQEGISAMDAATNREKANIELQQLQASTSPAAIFQYAQQYAATGTIPTGAPQGTSAALAAVAASLPKAPGQIYDSSTGVADPKLSADQETSISGLYNIINNVLPQLAGNYVPGSGVSGSLIANVSDYNDVYNSLKGALTALNTAGILKGDAATFISQVPDASHWYSSGIYTIQGKNQINSLTQTLTDQLNSYLNSNNLKVAGFNDAPPTTGADSSNNLSKFLSK